jgi:toxin ParE1/3/4
MKQIVIAASALRDLNRHFDYIAQRDESAALRFFDSARTTFADLARMPGMGSFYSKTRLPGLQRWRVKGFENFLIFYRTQEDAIEIVRVLPAAQDIDSLLREPI